MEDYTYKVKCRGCGKITSMWFSKSDNFTEEQFRGWANEHATYPIEHPCDCDKRSMLFHDIISYSAKLGK